LAHPFLREGGGGSGAFVYFSISEILLLHSLLQGGTGKGGRKPKGPWQTESTQPRLQGRSPLPCPVSRLSTLRSPGHLSWQHHTGLLRRRDKPSARGHPEQGTGSGTPASQPRATFPETISIFGTLPGLSAFQVNGGFSTPRAHPAHFQGLPTPRPTWGFSATKLGKSSDYELPPGSIRSC